MRLVLKLNSSVIINKTILKCFLDYSWVLRYHTIGLITLAGLGCVGGGEANKTRTDDYVKSEVMWNHTLIGSSALPGLKLDLGLLKII